MEHAHGSGASAGDDHSCGSAAALPQLECHGDLATEPLMNASTEGGPVPIRYGESCAQIEGEDQMHEAVGVEGLVVDLPDIDFSYAQQVAH